MKKEYNILNYFNMRALFFGLGISNMLILAKETIWLSLIIGTIFGLIILKTIKISIKRNIFNVIASSLFMIVGYVILVNLISTMYMTTTPKLIIGLPILLLLMYILNKKNLIVYRIGTVLIAINFIIYLLTIIFLIPHFDIHNFVITNTPFKDTLMAALYYALLSTVPTFATRTKDFEDYSLIKTYLISSISMSAIILSTYGILGENLSEMFRYPEYIVLKRIRLMNFVENFENIISFIWIYDLIMFFLSNGLNIKYNVNNKVVFNVILVIILIISTIINKYYIFLLPVYKLILPICLFNLLIFIIFNKKVKTKK